MLSGVTIFILAYIKQISFIRKLLIIFFKITRFFSLDFSIVTLQYEYTPIQLRLPKELMVYIAIRTLRQRFPCLGKE